MIFLLLIALVLPINGLWVQISSKQPKSVTSLPSKDSAVMCYDETAYIFGGKNKFRLSNDFQSWSIPKGREVRGVPPLVARSEAAAWHLHEKLFIFGGKNGSKTSLINSLNDFWIYSPYDTNWYQINRYGPEARYGAVTWTYSDAIYLYGGRSNSRTYKDLWGYTLNLGWFKVITSRNPGPLEGAKAVIYDQTVYVFGGTNGNKPNEQYSNFLGYNVATKEWSVLPSGPTPRKDHLMWYYYGNIYVLGGRNEYQVLTDFWQYNIDSNSWSQVGGNVPSARWGAGGCWGESKYYLFGGYIGTDDNSGKYLSDVWLWMYDHPPDPSGVAVTALLFTIFIICGSVIGLGYTVYKRTQYTQLN
jgi:N-acetylneuraminic acid mutarotase